MTVTTNSKFVLLEKIGYFIKLLIIDYIVNKLGGKCTQMGVEKRSLGLGVKI